MVRATISPFLFSDCCFLDWTVREFVLEEADLRQLAEIPTEGKSDPWDILCGNERGLVLTSDQFSQSVRACQREQTESD